MNTDPSSFSLFKNKKPEDQNKETKTKIRPLTSSFKRHRMSIKVIWDHRHKQEAIQQYVAHLAGLPPCTIFPPYFSSRRCCIRKSRLPPLTFVLIISSSAANSHLSQLQLQVQGTGWVVFFFLNAEEPEVPVPVLGCCILHRSIPWHRQGPGTGNFSYRGGWGLQTPLAAPGFVGFWFFCRGRFWFSVRFFGCWGFLMHPNEMAAQPCLGAPTSSTGTQGAHGGSW